MKWTALSLIPEAVSFLICTRCLSAGNADLAIEKGLLFYAPFDSGIRGLLVPYGAGIESPCKFQKTVGKVGNAVAVLQRTGIRYPLHTLISREEGSMALWLRVKFEPREAAIRWLIDLGRFAKLYQWKGQDYLTFALYYHHIDERHDYSWQASLEGWQPGQWRHIVITWSWSARRRRLYIDGKLIDERSINRIPNIINTFAVGRDAGVVDELCVYSREIHPEEVTRLYSAGQTGRPAFPFEEIPLARGAIETLPVSSPERPPSFVNWSFDGAEGRSNSVREEVTLHGWCRWQVGKTPYEPPGPQKWLYRKVPNNSRHTESFPVRDRDFQIVPHRKLVPGARCLNRVPQWCEREFALPARWRGRRIVLKLDSLLGSGAVFLNRKLLGSLPEENLGADYDITKRIRWRKPNRLTIFSCGIDGEIMLVSVPTEIEVQDAWLITSCRKKAVTARLEIRTERTIRVRTEIEIFDRDGKLKVKEFRASRNLRPHLTVVTFSSLWSDPKPWSLAQPYPYSYTVAVKDGSGRLLDRALPVRFGSREIWIEDGDFFLNGRPIHFIGHSNVHITSSAEIGDSEYIWYSFRRWKAVGINCITPWQGRGRRPTQHPLFDIADEMGMAVFGLPQLPTGEYTPESPDLRARWEQLYQRYIKRYRQHPSLLCWVFGSGSHTYDFCPAVLDGRFDTTVVPKAKPLLKTWALVQKVDPTRPVFGISNGNIGAVWTSMAYQGFDVDLQERENWPIRWTRKPRKPLMPMEFSLPCHPDWFTRPDRRSHRAQYRPKTSKPIATEYGAMLLGPRVHISEPEEYLRSLAKERRPQLSRAFWDIKLLFADTLKAWRAYGVSFVYHAEVPWFFTGNRPKFPTAASLDPRRRQATPEFLHGSLQAGDELSEFGRRVKSATAPLLFFVGGLDGNFTYKDHAFWSSEKLRKALIIVNDTDNKVRLLGNWTLTDTIGQQFGTETVEVRCKPGRQETERGLIRLRAPVVRKRTDLILKVSIEGVAVPPFQLTVFRKGDEAPPLDYKGFILFDPVSDTRRMLARLGVLLPDLPPKLMGNHRLIVGRRALADSENVQKLIRVDFDQGALNGMRALIFEQSAERWNGEPAGLRLKRLDTRRAFVRSLGHPVLGGLEESDFKYLRGDSDFIPPYPGEFDRMPKRCPKDYNWWSYPVHWWHWGNDNIVATYTLEKPQVGSARALLDCGFDLAETPLLEVSKGEGLIIFCQVDVTDRIPADPVSTTLVRNLLNYLSLPSFRPPAGATLEELHKTFRPTVTFEGYFSRADGIPGVHHGEVFFRERLRLPAFDTSAPTPLFKRVQLKGRSCWLPSFRVSDLRTEWQRAKLARIESALRFLNGERTGEGPQLQNRPELYPPQLELCSRYGSRL